MTPGLALLCLFGGLVFLLIIFAWISVAALCGIVSMTAATIEQEQEKARPRSVDKYSP